MVGCLFRLILVSVIVIALISIGVNNSDLIKQKVDKMNFFSDTAKKTIKYKTREEIQEQQEKY